MSDRITIQLATLDDADQLSQLMQKVIEPLPYYNDRAKQAEIQKYSSEGLKNFIKDEPDLIFVAKYNMTIIGFCINTYDSGLIWLSWYGVDENWQGYGVGKKLLDTLFKTATTKRIHKVWCDCRTDNHNSRSILQKAGFREVCTLYNHWYGQDFVILEKFITLS